MNKDFIITGIKRIMFVGRHEYPEKEIEFTGDLVSNEIIFHLSGKSTVYFNGKELQISPGRIRFLPKGKNDEYRIKKEISGDCIDVCFGTDCPISDEAFVINPQNTEKLRNLFKKIFSVWVSKNDGYYFECISLLYKIFAELQKTDYISEKQYRMIRPALEYIEENFLHEKISVVELAEKCGISESYLKKLFVKKIGISPVQYIIRLKINHACDLLLSGLYNVTRVSEMCGYSDMYYFSRQFKEYMGVSPTEFSDKYKSSK